ncbi:DUF3987 domain-containing protein [Aporhodopirellula aestuarii]|uniref:YfjI family protein n=1 Tax=Aporhodopirellula aestuarii TaxID=2950107 RepID=A0ABT0U4K5_9BACT|nr:DUF3987 domain-containing protein [Aporhodopirellula aestuarii]MCM2371854.1 YfjI family protein [Aporhodopirellula aestuarii]
MNEPTLTLTADPITPNGRRTIAATLDGETLHRDALFLERARDRRRFIDALVDKVPAIVEGADVSPEAIEDELLKLSERERPHARQPKETASPAEFIRFPDELLPPIVRKYVVRGAKARATDTSIVALPALVTLAACIGTTRKIAAKPDWTAPAIMWGAVVARSGSVKSVGYDLSYELLQPAEEANDREFSEAQRKHKANELEYRKKLKAWERSRDSGPSPEAPEPPIAKRFLVDDQTIESITLLLAENPRGLYLLSDELRGYFEGMGAYSSGGRAGRDEARWLMLFEGRAINVDRKTNRERTYVPFTGVSVAGTIQPRTLARVVSNGQIESGLLARLLLTMPTPRAKQWTDSTLSRGTRMAMEKVIDRLKTLDHEVVDGFRKPIVLPLTDEARRRFSAFVNAHGAETIAHEDALAAAWSKLEGYALRFALVDHLTRWASGDPNCEHDGPVGLQSIEIGIEMSRWFAHEAERVYNAIGIATHCEPNGTSPHVNRLAEWIATHGGSASEREIRRGPRRYRGGNHIEEDCRELIASGRASWRVTRKTRRLVLRETSDTGDGDTSPAKTRIPTNASPTTGADKKPVRRPRKTPTGDTLAAAKRKRARESPSPGTTGKKRRKKRTKRSTELAP